MRPLLLHWHSRPVTQVKCNYDGDLLVTCAKDGVATLGRLSTGERIGTYDGHNGAIYAVDITMDSKYVVTASADGQVIVFDAMTGKALCVLKHGGLCKFCEWNQKPGAQRLVLTCNDAFRGSENIPNRICVWEWDEDEKELDIQLTIDDDLKIKATKVKWGPADKTLISIHDEGTIWIWDFPSGKKLQTLTAHTQPMTDIQFNYDRMLMITCSRDSTAKLWETKDFTCVKTYKTDRPLNSAAISPLYNATEAPKYHVMLGGGQDAREVTTSSASSGKFEAVLYHMVTQEELGSIQGHFGPLNNLTFFTDGKGYVTGGEDGYIRIHHFDPDYFNTKRWD